VENIEDLSGHFESWDPPAGREPLDGAGHRALAAAAKQTAQAVALARELGYTWEHIGLLLGLSGEAARQAYGPH
jgi:hypothetical protein